MQYTADVVHPKAKSAGAVQWAHSSLSRIPESNAGLNPTDRMRQVGSVYATDKAYLGVLDGVRKQLGRNIDFSKQGDREAIGNALIHDRPE